MFLKWCGVFLCFVIAGVLFCLIFFAINSLRYSILFFSLFILAELIIYFVVGRGHYKDFLLYCFKKGK